MSTDIWKSQIHIHLFSGFISSFFFFYSSLKIAINFTMPHLTLPLLPFCSQCAEHEQPAVWLSHAVAGALADWQPVPAVCLCYLCSSCQPSWSQRPFHQSWRVCLWSVPFSIFLILFSFSSQPDPILLFSEHIRKWKWHWVSGMFWNHWNVWWIISFTQQRLVSLWRFCSQVL